MRKRVRDRFLRGETPCLSAASRLFAILLVAAMPATIVSASEAPFSGIVSSATPEATAAGVRVLEAGGNAVDAAIAVSLVLGVTEPAGSGIAGQTVILIKRPGEDAFVIHGTSFAPRSIPSSASSEQLRHGRTASTVPSTLRVLDLAWRRFGSGELSWPALLQPAIDHAGNGFVVGPFRHRAFRNYHADLARDPTAAAVFLKPDGTTWQTGDTVRQPLLAATLKRIADAGAMDFYTGAMAREIAADMDENGGWIDLGDLEEFPEPAIVPAISSSYRGYMVETLPPPFGGWVVLQILNVLEHLGTDQLSQDDDDRRLALLDALRAGHESRRREPITDYTNYGNAVRRMTSKSEALSRLAALRGEGGETTHFSVVDGDGMAVSVTQSIDSYFGAGVMHPTLGFLYNNYMQGFQVDAPDAPYYLAESEMPLSSMSATIVSRDGVPQLVLGSPGSARIISAVAQVVSHWIDVNSGIDAAVSAYRVHVVPEDKAYVEGPELSATLMSGMAERGLRLMRPTYGVSDSHLDPYFGGVHAVAVDHGSYVGAADPRRDGAARAAVAAGETAGSSEYSFNGWDGPPLRVRLYTPPGVNAETPVVIVMHGWSRDAQRYFSDWEKAARENQFIAAVPHFPVEDFPGSNDYNLGHVFDKESGAVRPNHRWTFAAIEALFDDVVARTGSGQTQYTLYGHSAGGQFVHRFAYYMPDARVKRFIAANSGWYTMPDLATPYPYGLSDAALSERELSAAFDKDVVLLLGREDTDYDDPNLRTTPEADRQGPNRFVRGLTMFSVAKTEAERMDTELRWRVVIVDDAGHDNAAMTPAAAALVE